SGVASVCRGSLDEPSEPLLPERLCEEYRRVDLGPIARTTDHRLNQCSRRSRAAPELGEVEARRSATNRQPDKWPSLHIRDEASSEVCEDVLDVLLLRRLAPFGCRDSKEHERSPERDALFKTKGVCPFVDPSSSGRRKPTDTAIQRIKDFTSASVE